MQSRLGTVRWHFYSAALLTLFLCAGGCTDDGPSTGELEKVWGRRGLGDGRFQKPRAMAIDDQDQIYVVDMTARIQVFDREGKFLRSWQTPVHTNGRPTGMSFDRQGRLLVADTHYFRVLIYSPTGELLETFGGTHGHEPGQFGLVTDAVQDASGCFYVSEYGGYDRIQKLSPTGECILEWGGHGPEPGKFSRPQSLRLDRQGNLWVADACNHRIQVFDSHGKLIRYWGHQGSAPGELCYPYDLVFDEEENLYVCEFGNHRIQKFSQDGKSLGAWGISGRQPGELYNPWALVQDSQGAIHVLDTYNHRVQRIRF